MDTCYSCGEKLKVVKDQPYHYDECGLNVVLFGVTQHVCEHCHETYASIPDMQNLHRFIGKVLCEQRKALLRPTEIKFLRKDLQLKAKDLARTLGVTPETVSRWENGKKEIGEAHDRLLRSIYMGICAEQNQGSRQDSIINIFKGFPLDRKRIQQPREIAINPQEWMVNHDTVRGSTQAC